METQKIDNRGAHNTYVTIGASNHSQGEREPNDYYATEPLATELLLDVEKFSEYIWEPACGEGHMSKVLKDNGYKVYSTDLVSRGYEDNVMDFLQYNGAWEADIVTNPPYNIATEFVTKALEIIPEGNKVAMFLKLQFLETKGRRTLFQKYPPKTVYVSSSRLCCAKNGEFDIYNSKAIAYAWFVWEKGFEGDTTLKWIN